MMSYDLREADRGTTNLLVGGERTVVDVADEILGTAQDVALREEALAL